MWRDEAYLLDMLLAARKVEKDLPVLISLLEPLVPPDE